MATVAEQSPITARDLWMLQEYVGRRSERSLAEYLDYVVIDSRPDPVAWSYCREPWQDEIVMPMIPAIEQVAGLRKDYSGPRSFFYVLPKGHDKTGLIGRVCNWVVGFSRNKIRAYAAASSKDQAKLLLDSMSDEARLNPWIEERIKITNYVINGNGGKVRVLSADARHSSGIKADLIICDELTFWENRELFDILFSSREKRPDSVFIVICNAGLIDSWQWELLQVAKAHPDRWHVYEAPHDQTMASWMTKDAIEDMRKSLRPGFARRVLDNRWIHATETPLLTWELIQSCIDEDCLWPSWEIPPGKRPQLYMGVDFGRTKNRTVIWLAEAVRDIAVTRQIIVMQNKPFAEQEQFIRRILETKRVVKAKLDKGAQGWTTVENLERDFRSICEGEHLTRGFQGQIATEFKTAFERRAVRVPNNSTMIADLQRVSEVETVNGKPVVRSDESADGWHADHFWAGALCKYAMPVKQRRKVGLPIGLKTKV